jgi:hypothetical protein
MAVKSKVKTRPKPKSKSKPKPKPQSSSRTKAKTKAKSKPKARVRSGAAKGKPVKKTRPAAAKTKKAVKPKTRKTAVALKTKSRSAAPVLDKPAPARSSARSLAVAPRTSAAPVVKRTVTSGGMRPKPAKRILRAAQYSYMKPPGVEHVFDVGDSVEVFCDHEKNRERVRGWIRGIVVQVDYKLVAVQFRSNVFLTDGWMVPDRILWYPLTSEHIRPAPGKKSAVKKELLLDY